jgi:hypothetical protein
MVSVVLFPPAVLGDVTMLPLFEIDTPIAGAMVSGKLVVAVTAALYLSVAVNVTV